MEVFAVWFDYLLRTAGGCEMSQMAFKQITPDDVGWPFADFSSAKIRINFKVDTFTLQKKKKKILFMSGGGGSLWLHNICFWFVLCGLGYMDSV